MTTPLQELSVEQLQRYLEGTILLIKSTEKHVEELEIKQTQLRAVIWEYKATEAKIRTQIDLKRPPLNREKILHLKPRKTP